MGPRKSLTVLITESSWPASHASPRKAPAMCNLLLVALPLSPHLAASRRHFQRCFYLLQHLVHSAPPPATRFTLILGPEICFLQLWQSSTRFLNLVFEEMVGGGAPPAGRTDLGFLFGVPNADLPLDVVQVKAWDGHLTSRVSACSSRGSGHSTWAPHSYTRFHYPFAVHTRGSVSWDKSAFVNSFLQKKIPHHFSA